MEHIRSVIWLFVTIFLIMTALPGRTFLAILAFVLSAVIYLSLSIAFKSYIEKIEILLMTAVPAVSIGILYAVSLALPVKTPEVIEDETPIVVYDKPLPPFYKDEVCGDNEEPADEEDVFLSVITGDYEVIEDETSDDNADAYIVKFTKDTPSYEMENILNSAGALILNKNNTGKECIISVDSLEIGAILDELRSNKNIIEVTGV